MPVTAKRLRIGVFGAGTMGRNHARILTTSDRAELAVVMDPSAAAREYVEQMRGCPTVATVDEAIALQLDAAVVAVPTIHHHAVALALIEAGIHVLIEKPIASTVAAARELITRSAERDVILTVGHVERFNPAIRTLFNAIGDEPIISIAISRVGPFPPRIADVGIVIDLGVHDIDLIRWLSRSEISVEQALLMRSRGGVHEDIAFLQFQLESGALAHINTNWLTPFKERRINVSTASRFIVCDMLNRTVNEYSGFATDEQPEKFGAGSYVSRSLNVPFVEPLRAEIDAFIDAIEGKASPTVTGRDGLRSLEVALACLSNP
jgi:UDP-N-acetylglucosamine 3-dehydrogenase